MSVASGLAAVRRQLAEHLGLTELRASVQRLERRVESLEIELESREDSWKRSRARWRAAQPTASLTWGAELTGDAFIDRAEHHGAFGPGRHVAEVGPGYGRLLRTVLERELPFGSYTGVDLSAENVAHLSAQFADERVSFVIADVEEVSFAAPVDAVLSSLTFKHLFPSFQTALANVASQMAPGGVLLFDLIEGSRRYFEEDAVTYIREYERPEVEAILTAEGIEPVAFEEIRHHPSLARLLVVGRKRP